LVVHSAEWTERMKAEFLAGEAKSDYETLVRTCGFGVPDIGRALWSASNSLTLVVEDSLRPFTRQGSKPATARDMHLHLLPWPQQELLNLGNEEVEMRVKPCPTSWNPIRVWHSVVLKGAIDTSLMGCALRSVDPARMRHCSASASTNAPGKKMMTPRT